MTNLFAQIEQFNIDERYGINDGDVQETFTSNRGELYRCCLDSYGRCVGKLFIEGRKQPIGWAFHKREKYDDCNETFLCETVVTVHERPPTKTVEYHYA